MRAVGYCQYYVNISCLQTDSVKSSEETEQLDQYLVQANLAPRMTFPTNSTQLSVAVETKKCKRHLLDSIFRKDEYRKKKENFTQIVLSIQMPMAVWLHNEKIALAKWLNIEKNDTILPRGGYLAQCPKQRHAEL